MSRIALRLEERFRRYSGIPSQSNAKNIGRCLPTSPGQQKLAELLAGELSTAGLANVECDEHATVTALKKGNVRGTPTIGFICHLDTFDAGLSPEVHPQKILYTGGDVQLNTDVWLRAAEHPEIAPYVGQEILFSDGTSVLGADDKAAVSAVMEMVTSLGDEDTHGDIYICFVPDEEIGLLGAKHLDVKRRFPVDFAYTLDCCELGEVVYECFNAASVSLVFTGVTAHPMSAKGVMVNPVTMAMEYMSHFDPLETPEHTELREGYCWFLSVEANPTVAKVTAAIRDHDWTSYTARKQKMEEVATIIRDKYPRGTVEVTIEDVYENISNALKDDTNGHRLAARGAERGGRDPQDYSHAWWHRRGGPSAKGLLTPNFFTGAHNFHSRFEFLPIPSFVKSYEVARTLSARAKHYKKKTTPNLLIPAHRMTVIEKNP
ncbi:peptidase T [Angomonas deanei]|nr:peptidase T [Angomonas deanei]|eukprot:EPY33111.1 peptidase T [Angomonas deanei]